MEKNYKAKTIKVKNVDEWGYKLIETRWAIVNIETGEIIDDAQGYGYKTASGAYRAFGWKSKHRNKKTA